MCFLHMLRGLECPCTTVLYSIESQGKIQEFFARYFVAGNGIANFAFFYGISNLSLLNWRIIVV